MRTEDFDASRRKLIVLTRDNASQQQRLLKLDERWLRWQTEFIVPMQAMCDRPPDATRPSSVKLTRLAETGNVLRNDLKKSLAELEAAEQQLLDTRQSDLADAQSGTAATLVFAALGALAVLGVAALSLLSAAGTQDGLNRELENEVAERRVAERRLADSEARVRAVLDHVLDAIVTVDVRGVIKSVNPAAVAMFGYPAGDIIGQNASMLMPGSQRGAHGIADGIDANDFVVARRGGVLGTRHEMSARHADGQRFAIDVAFMEISIDGERRYTRIIRDISDVKRQEEEIKRFKVVLDNALDMIYMFDPVTLVLVYVNRGAIETLGYGREELLAMRAFELTPAMLEHVFRAHIAPLASGEKPGLSYEAVQRKRDGSDLPAEIFLQLVREAKGVGLFVAIARDLTERRRIDLMKSEFVSIVSHELRTPLTSIRGSLSLLMGGTAGELPETGRHMVEIALRNSERLARLINDILDIDKIESGKSEFAMQALDMAALVEHAVDAHRAYGEQYGVRFVVAQDADLATAGGALLVHGDTGRLMQVLANLLSNAAKFAPKNSEVRVAFARRRDRVRVAVSDGGPGIPEAFRDRVFEKFSQADASDARQKGGTGLGLSICKAIVERHDGVIGFDSQSESTPGDSGTTFWFELPVCDEPPPAISAIAAPHLSVTNK